VLTASRPISAGTQRARHRHRLDVSGPGRGLAIGFFSKKVHSLTWGVVFGLALGLFLAFLVAAMPQPGGKHYYFEIMLPGAIVGAIVGYATQVYRGRSVSAA
jgi:hypothetical protein